MAGVGLGPPDRVLVSRLPVAAAKLGIGEERPVGVLLLRPWVQGPGSRRSAEVRDARVGRDSRTAEHHQAAHPVSPLRGTGRGGRFWPPPQALALRATPPCA